MRAAPEQQMIADIHCMIAAGQDLDWIDAHGATLVRTWASTKTSQNGSGPAHGGTHNSTSWGFCFLPAGLLASFHLNWLGSWFLSASSPSPSFIHSHGVLCDHPGLPKNVNHFLNVHRMLSSLCVFLEIEQKGQLRWHPPSEALNGAG